MQKPQAFGIKDEKMKSLVLCVVLGSMLLTPGDCRSAPLERRANLGAIEDCLKVVASIQSCLTSEDCSLDELLEQGLTCGLDIVNIIGYEKLLKIKEITKHLIKKLSARLSNKIRTARMPSTPKNNDLAPGQCDTICIGYLCIEEPICALAEWHYGLCSASPGYDIDIPCIVSGVIYTVAYEIIKEIEKEIQNFFPDSFPTSEPWTDGPWSWTDGPWSWTEEPWTGRPGTGRPGTDEPWWDGQGTAEPWTDGYWTGRPAKEETAAAES